MQIDKEKVCELACKYAAWCEDARRLEEEMDAARREARGVLDELMEYLDKANADNKLEKPVPSVPLVSCLECKHAERLSDDINTWRCTVGAGFAGYVKVECKRFEAL